MVHIMYIVTVLGNKANIMHINASMYIYLECEYAGVFMP